MPSVSGFQGILISNLPLFDASDARKLPDEHLALMEDAWKRQFLEFTGKPDNHPEYTYAVVKVAGTVVATLYNSGGAETSNATYSKVRDLPSMGEAETLTGPALAKKRAEEIAAAMGGTVEVIATPQSLAAWNNRPAPQWTYNYQAMDAALQAKLSRGQANYHAQLLAQADPADAAMAMEAAGEAETPETSESSMQEVDRLSPRDEVIAEFLKYMEMTPAERLWLKYLQEEGLTPEEYEALSPEEQAKIAAKIRERIEMAIKQGIEKGESPAAAVAQGDPAMDVAASPASLDSLPPPLFPTAENIARLSKETEAAFRDFLAQHDIPSPSSITYGQDGSIQLPPDYAHADTLKQALAKDPAMERTLRTTYALTTHFVAFQESLPFLQEYLAAGSQAETAGITEKYSHLFGNHRRPANVALLFAADGSLTITANGKPYQSPNA